MRAYLVLRRKECFKESMVNSANFRCKFREDKNQKVTIGLGS